MTPQAVCPAIFLCFALAACVDTSEIKELDNKIADRTAKLAAVDKALAQIEGSVLPGAGARDLRTSFNYGPFRQWIREISNPGYVISARGISHTGDIIYVGNVGHAWLEPEKDTQFHVRISNVDLLSLEGKLILTGRLTLNAKAQLKTYVLNIGSTVGCPMDQVSFLFSSVVRPEAISDHEMSYTFRVTSPDSINGTIRCGLQGLPDLIFNVKYNGFAKEWSKGKIGLGFKSEGSFNLPGPNGDIKKSYIITARNPHLSFGSESIDYATNVDVILKHKD